MGQKIHPLALRVQASTRQFDHAWYSDQFFSKLISVDLAIFKYVNTFLKLVKLPLGRFSLYHLPKTTKLYNFFCYPKQSREYKSRIFSISTGLGSMKSKKYRDSQISEVKFSRKSLHKNALNDSLLFNQVVNSNNRLLDSRSSTGGNTLNEFLNIFSYNLSRSRNFTGNSSNQNNLEYFHLTSRNTKTLSKSISPYISTFKNGKNSRFDESLQNSLVDSWKFSQTSSFKNSLPCDIIDSLKNLLIFSKIYKSPYRVAKTISNPNKFFVSSQLDTRVKYKNILETSLSKFLKSSLTLIPFRVNFEWQDAGYFADEIVFLLERRVSFRQIKNKLIRQFAQNPHIQGIRITCSGRVGGKSKKAQRAKMESIKYGQTSLHVFSSRIDFAVRTASTSLGSTGVKVWICYK